MTAPPQRLKVFLSYTHSDLDEHARSVRQAIDSAGFQGVQLEDFAAADQPPVPHARQLIADSDALVVLVGFRYGGVPSIDEGGDGKRSHTWLQVMQAQESRIPVLAFCVDDKVPVPRDFIDAANLNRLAEFKSYLRTQRLVGSFTSASDAAKKVVATLNQLRERGELGRQSPGPPAQAASASQAPDLSQPERARVDMPDDELLSLAWHLVVYFKKDPDLLLHLDTTRWVDAVQKLAEEIGADRSNGWKARLSTMRAHLIARQPGVQPNPLWLAWMKNVQTAKVDGLRYLPALSAPPESAAATANQVEMNSAPSVRSPSPNPASPSRIVQRSSSSPKMPLSSKKHSSKKK